jgi:N-acylglucosamine 2-epimerase
MSHLHTDKYLKLFREELFERVIPFWLSHSLDREHGGYFNCLDRDGRVYDTTKHMWLQSRQVWMLSRLYNTVERNPAWLDAARLGLEFIRKYGRNPEGRVYFSLTADGRPVSLQRKPFAECFFCLALLEYSRATNDPVLRAEAEELFARVRQWIADPAALGRPVLPGQSGANALAVPMMLLALADEFSLDSDSPLWGEITGRSLEEIYLHVKPEQKLVFENVGPGGALLEGSEGRLLNPGHAIETGWFVLEQARRRKDQRARKIALEMIDWSFEKGWDAKNGGIFYFLDSGGFSPVQLEWSMKLWWPHAEAAYALLLAWRETGEKMFAERFEKVVEYSFSHFSDRQYGEWFGYLDCQGRPTHLFKGGPYKGCFHVPRFLWLCISLLEGTR